MQTLQNAGLPETPAYADRLLSEPIGLSSLDALRLEWMGLSTRARRMNTGPVLTPFHLIMFSVDRGIRYQLAQERIRRLDGPSLVMIGKDRKSQTGGPDDRPSQRRYYLLSGTWADDWVRFGWLPHASLSMPLPNPATAEMIHHRIALAIIENDGRALDQGKLELASWLAGLHAFRARNAKPRKQQECVREVVDGWRRNPQNEVHISRWAAECGLSVSRFRAVLKNTYGCSAHDLIVRTRVDYACRLMCERDDLLLKQVAFASGFKTVETFNRCVRRFRKMAPGELRTMLASSEPSTVPPESAV